VVFKRDLKEASEGADRRSGSREFHTDGTAVEKARDAKYEVTAGGFENSRADDDRGVRRDVTHNGRVQLASD